MITIEPKFILKCGRLTPYPFLIVQLAHKEAEGPRSHLGALVTATPADRKQESLPRLLIHNVTIMNLLVTPTL